MLAPFGHHICFCTLCVGQTVWWWSTCGQWHLFHACTSHTVSCCFDVHPREVGWMIASFVTLSHREQLPERRQGLFGTTDGHHAWVFMLWTRSGPLSAHTPEPNVRMAGRGPDATTKAWSFDEALLSPWIPGRNAHRGGRGELPHHTATSPAPANTSCEPWRFGLLPRDGGDTQPLRWCRTHGLEQGATGRRERRGRRGERGAAACQVHQRPFCSWTATSSGPSSVCVVAPFCWRTHHQCSSPP